MKRIMVLMTLSCLFLLSAAHAQFTNRFESLVTLKGDEYKNARPKRIEDNTLVVFHSSGIARVALSDLPDEILSAIGLQTRAEAAQERERKKAEARQNAEIKKQKERAWQASIAEQRREQEARLKDPARKKRIEKGFSAWDGSHRKLTQQIKASMNDPKSYKHVETLYWDTGKKWITVKTTFRGKNAFGGMVVNWVRAECDLDGNVISIVEQGP